MNKLKTLFLQNYMVLIFVITFAGMLGSLFFSEIYHLDPCKLCWYQRIFMYPVAIQSAVSVLFKAKIRKVYLFVLTFPGMFFALYQYYTQIAYGQSDVNVCGGDISCSFIDFSFLGFITIPFLSFLLLNIIIALAFYLERKGLKRNEIES